MKNGARVHFIPTLKDGVSVTLRAPEVMTDTHDQENGYLSRAAEMAFNLRSNLLTFNSLFINSIKRSVIPGISRSAFEYGVRTSLGGAIYRAVTSASIIRDRTIPSYLTGSDGSVVIFESPTFR